MAANTISSNLTSLLTTGLETGGQFGLSTGLAFLAGAPFAGRRVKMIAMGIGGGVPMILKNSATLFSPKQDQPRAAGEAVLNLLGVGAGVLTALLPSIKLIFLANAFLSFGLELVRQCGIWRRSVTDGVTSGLFAGASTLAIGGLFCLPRLAKTVPFQRRSEHVQEPAGELQRLMRPDDPNRVGDWHRAQSVNEPGEIWMGGGSVPDFLGAEIWTLGGRKSTGLAVALTFSNPRGAKRAFCAVNNRMIRPGAAEVFGLQPRPIGPGDLSRTPVQLEYRHLLGRHQRAGDFFAEKPTGGTSAQWQWYEKPDGTYGVFLSQVTDEPLTGKESALELLGLALGRDVKLLKK